jgi:hypothetical protein
VQFVSLSRLPDLRNFWSVLWSSVPTLAWLIPLGSLIAPCFSLQSGRVFFSTRFTSLLRPVSVTLATAGWCLPLVCESPSVAAAQISSLVILLAT